MKCNCPLKSQISCKQNKQIYSRKLHTKPTQKGSQRNTNFLLKNLDSTNKLIKFLRNIC